MGIYNLILATVCLVSCSTTDISPARKHYEAGEFTQAAQKISEIHPQDEKGLATGSRSEDNIWLLLEKGKMLMDSGRWQESNVAFLEADRILKALDEEAKVSLGAVRSGAASILLDDRQSDYVGTTYDKILLPAYICINYMMLGNFEAAATAARQFDEYENVADLARKAEVGRIAEMDKEVGAKDEGGNPKHGVEVNSSNGIALSEAKFISRPEEFRKEGDPMSIQSFIQDFANPAAAMAGQAGSGYSIPFARLVGAIALEAAGEREMADGMLSTLAEKKRPGHLAQERTAYVVFECGNVPKRLDKSFTFTYAYLAKVKVKDKDGNVHEEERLVPSMVKLPFVGLSAQSSAGCGLKVTAGTASMVTAPLDDISSVVAREYNDALAGLIARIAIRALIQEVAQITVNEQIGMLGVIGGGLLKSLVEPDLRGWESLGAMHQVGTVQVPDDGNLKLELTTGGAKLAEGSAQSGLRLDLKVPVGPPVLIYVRATTMGNFIAHSCPLAKAPKN